MEILNCFLLNESANCFLHEDLHFFSLKGFFSASLQDYIYIVMSISKSLKAFLNYFSPAVQVIKCLISHNSFSGPSEQTVSSE